MIVYELSQEKFKLKDILTVTGLPESTYHYHYSKKKKRKIKMKRSKVLFKKFSMKMMVTTGIVVFKRRLKIKGIKLTTNELNA